MNKYNSIRATDKTYLSEQTRFRLVEINKIENYFIEEINQRKSYSQKLSKYVTIFDYADKTLIVLSATNRGVSIISFRSIVGASVGIASESFNFFSNNWNNKKLLNITIKKRKRSIKFLCWLKVNSIVLTH